MSLYTRTISAEEARTRYGIKGTDPVILSGPRENLNAEVEELLKEW